MLALNYSLIAIRHAVDHLQHWDPDESSQVEMTFQATLHGRNDPRPHQSYFIEEWDHTNALGRPFNDSIESWKVSYFEA
jgi:hypothetical protein